jgi:hypothetical protein
MPFAEFMTESSTVARGVMGREPDAIAMSTSRANRACACYPVAVFLEEPYSSGIQACPPSSGSNPSGNPDLRPHGLTRIIARLANGLDAVPRIRRGPDSRSAGAAMKEDGCNPILMPVIRRGGW